MDADLPHLLARPISSKDLHYPSVRFAQFVIPAAIESVQWVTRDAFTSFIDDNELEGHIEWIR